jgi:hypothetical protein
MRSDHMKRLAVAATTILLTNSQGIASVFVGQLSVSTYKVIKRDDNDPAVEVACVDRIKFLRNGFEKKRIPIFSYRTVLLSPAEWEREMPNGKTQKMYRLDFPMVQGGADLVDAISRTPALKAGTQRQQ